ncbi:MAG: hypothetical protein AAFO98_10010 [Pseudomonadota bacterium]
MFKKLSLAAAFLAAFSAPAFAISVTFGPETPTANPAPTNAELIEYDEVYLATMVSGAGILPDPGFNDTSEYLDYHSTWFGGPQALWMHHVVRPTGFDFTDITVAATPGHPDMTFRMTVTEQNGTQTVLDYLLTEAPQTFSFNFQDVDVVHMQGTSGPSAFRLYGINDGGLAPVSLPASVLLLAGGVGAMRLAKRRNG